LFSGGFLGQKNAKQMEPRSKVPHPVDRPSYQHEEIDLNCEVSSYAKLNSIWLLHLG
jgi:hypothetical protein